jgi:hydroxyethylthiazole kinase
MTDVAGKIGEALEKVREKRPLVHHMTNFVVMNDCANITLHIGGSPVMAHAPEEVEEMVGLADCLVLNIGTLTTELIDAMVTAGRRANEKGIPVLLDPVGTGATAMRTEAAGRILKEVRISFIKGNAGEVSVLAGVEAVVRGVDSAGTSGEPSEVAKQLAAAYGCTVIITGAVDFVSDGERTYSVHNGHSLMGTITGTGCMSGSLVGAFAGTVDDPVLAALAGLVCFGVAGELAAKQAPGPASFKRALLDEVSGLTAEKVTGLARVNRL